MPLGHAGHWLTIMAAAVPPVAVVAWIGVTLHDRRRVRRGP